jgi:hypothetical protein
MLNNFELQRKAFKEEKEKTGVVPQEYLEIMLH